MTRKKIDRAGVIKSSPSYKKLFDTMDARIRFAVEVNEARVLRGWTQEELAKEARTTQKVVSKIESGDVNLGFDLMQRVVRCLDLRLQIGKVVLIGGVDPHPAASIGVVANSESSQEETKGNLSLDSEAHEKVEVKNSKSFRFVADRLLEIK